MGRDGFVLGLFLMEIIIWIISTTKSVSTFKAEEFLIKLFFFIGCFYSYRSVMEENAFNYHILKLAKHSGIDSVTSVLI